MFFIDFNSSIKKIWIGKLKFKFDREQRFPSMEPFVMDLKYLIISNKPTVITKGLLVLQFYNSLCDD